MQQSTGCFRPRPPSPDGGPRPWIGTGASACSTSSFDGRILDHLTGRRTLLLRRQPHMTRGISDQLQQDQPGLHLLGTFLHGHHRCIGLLTNTTNDHRDITRRRLGTLRQTTHLLSHDCEPATLLTRTRRLDRRVQRQQVRLIRNVIDQIEQPSNVLHPPRQRQRPLTRSLNISLGLLQVVASLRSLSSNLTHGVSNHRRRTRQLLRRRRVHLHPGGLRSRLSVPAVRSGKRRLNGNEPGHRSGTGSSSDLTGGGEGN